MNLLKFEVRFPDGRKEVMVIDSQRALVGSGAHCDVRLPLDQAANEHVLVEVAGASVRVEARSYEPPTLLNGAPYQTAMLPPDQPLSVGAVQIFVALVDSNLLGTSDPSKKGDTSPLLKVIALVVFPAAVFMLLSDVVAGIDPPPGDLPEIFTAPVTVCPQTAPDRAAAVAHEKILQADGKRERSPFVPQEGISAVALYETAAVCFKTANKPASSKDAAHSAKTLKESITADYRSRRVRLEHSLKVEDWELAKRDVKVLRAVTDGKKGDYTTWLSTVNQQIKQQTGAPAEQ